MKKILLALLLFPAMAHSQLDSVFAYIIQSDSLDAIETGLPCWIYTCQPVYFHRWIVADSGMSLAIGCADSSGLVNCQFVNPSGQVMMDTQCVCIDRQFHCQKLAYLAEVPAGSMVIVSSATPMLIEMEAIPATPPYQVRNVIALMDTLCGAFSQPQEFDEPAKPLEAPAPVIDMRTFKPVRREDMVPWLDYKEFKKH